MSAFEEGISAAASRATRFESKQYASLSPEVIRASRIGTHNEDVRDTAARLNVRHADVHRAIAFEHLPDELRGTIVAEFRAGLTALHICNTYGCSAAAVQHCLREKFNAMSDRIDRLSDRIDVLRGAV